MSRIHIPFQLTLDLQRAELAKQLLEAVQNNSEEKEVDKIMDELINTEMMEDGRWKSLMQQINQKHKDKVKHAIEHQDNTLKR